MGTEIKLGDWVRRKRDSQGWPWSYADQAFKVTGFNSDFVILDGVIDGLPWDKINFEPSDWRPTAPDEAGVEDDPFTTQVGGDHYKVLPIQPIEYITKNNLGWCEGNIIKYITRWKQKGGLADIDKVIDYANKLKAMQ